MTGSGAAAANRDNSLSVDSFPAFTPVSAAGDGWLAWMYCGPVLRHSAGAIQAANFRSAIAF
jgi:hypothetical protein